MSAISLGDVVHRTLRVLLGNRCFTKVGLAAGSNTAKCQIAAAAEYCINGMQYSKAITDDLFVFTDVDPQPASTTCYYAMCLDSGGNSVVVNGAAVATASITAGTAAATLPEVADTVTMVGAVKVVTGAGGTFVPGTTGLAVAGNVAAVTFYNISCVPAGTL